MENNFQINLDYNKLLELKSVGEISDMIITLDDKVGRLKRFVGKKFGIIDSQFQTNSQTNTWEHISRENFLELNFIIEGGVSQSQENLYQQLACEKGFHSWVYNPNAKEVNQLISQGNYHFFSVYLEKYYAISILKKLHLSSYEIIDKIHENFSWEKHHTIRNFSKGLFYIITNIWNNAPKAPQLQSLYFESIIMQILCLQAEIFWFNYEEKIPPSIRESEKEVLLKIEKILVQNIENTISIKDICKKVALNEQKLKSLFKNYFGSTIHKYIQDLRMNKALELILYSNKTISEIAFELGYAHSQHFHRAFKKKFGIVPSSIRK